MNADDLIAAFNELAHIDAETRIDRTKVGDAETVRLVPSWNKGTVRRFKALAADAAALFDPAGPGDPVTRWLRFVLDHAPELVEDRERGRGRSLGYVIEHHDDGTERRVRFIAETLPDAASASALVVRRCRTMIERGELIERARSAQQPLTEPPSSPPHMSKDKKKRRRSPAMSLEQFGEALVMEARTFKRRAEAEWDLQLYGASRQRWTVGYSNMDESTIRQIEDHAEKIRESRRARKKKKRRAAK